ncbi:EAL domain-containing protein [Synechocystis sp. PCC 7339]|uniref:putative bifunctional diguanylate cyclase/phosphodiesterase n=2 Tax=unclassified Synechocystis TaxID=2640012 RepID=UPI001BAF607B|nr:EAL domain-containing protein [Synechocystis sp. PCC 7339]QUS59892.1 EAL domain-containing protein [Synechocystis sp. PCC 7338]UAJ72652.1 EAL domain-containing protein [Synechocystis sp. PCC 7339]
MNSPLYHGDKIYHWFPNSSLDFVSSPQVMLDNLSQWFRNFRIPNFSKIFLPLHGVNVNIATNSTQFNHPIQNLAWEMAHCLEQNNFHLHYQPQVDLKTGALLGVETLIRWHHPRLGLISPAEFIPIAEQTGLIVPMGYWVLQQSCLQYQRWLSQGIPPFKLSVNLSLRQLQEQNLVTEIKNIVNQTKINCQQITLEVTESLMLYEPGETINRLNQLNDMGIQIAIDDFGVGYSSLSYLKDLPLQTLKIDKSFLDDLLAKEKNQVILQTIIELGHRLGLKIVAEGVESLEQLAVLKSMDCDYGQGYLFSRPLTDQDVTALFRTSSFLESHPLATV